MSITLLHFLLDFGADLCDMMQIQMSFTDSTGMTFKDVFIFPSSYTNWCWCVPNKTQWDKTNLKTYLHWNLHTVPWFLVISCDFLWLYYQWKTLIDVTFVASGSGFTCSFLMQCCLSMTIQLSSISWPSTQSKWTSTDRWYTQDEGFSWSQWTGSFSHSF